MRPCTDYSKVVIYKIVPNDKTLNFVYVDYTTDFVRRKAQHKKVIKRTKHLYDFVMEHGGWDCFTIAIIEKFPCSDNIDAKIRVQYWTDLLNSEFKTL